MNLKTRWNKFVFELAVRRIRDTPPVEVSEGGPIVLSMVQHRDVLPYLLALKSFARYIRPAAVVMVADPSITDADRDEIRQHVPAIEFRDVPEFRRPGIPQGGCWERFCAVSEYVAKGYVIQLDADTVAVGPMPEVESAVRDGVAFTLGTEDGQQVQTCAEIAAWARGRLSGKDHVQLIAESCLGDVEGADTYRYFRGCAGFAGYPKNSFEFATMATFSGRMGKAMGPRWNEWGTEQFSSNVIVASMPGFRGLPHPKYCAPHRRVPGTVFYHFIGYVRYASSLYSELAKKIPAGLATRA